MASTGLNSSVRGPDTAAATAGIAVALTTYNDARTVGTVARAVREGLARHFGSNPAQLILADTGSTDGTRDAARAAAGDLALVEVEAPAATALAAMPYHGRPGRAGALRAALQAAQRSGAQACAMVDSGLETMDPERIERLVAPVLRDGFDYVSPYYLRRVNEGAMTKGIVYPMFRALYGARLRQPAAGEFGCSARLAAHLLEQDFWDAEQAQVGIDLWVAIAAVSGDFRPCEAPLGVRRVAPREMSPDLSTTLAQIAGALFADLEVHVDVWQRTRGSTSPPVVGTAPAPADEPAAVNVDGLTESFRLGYRELRDIWTWVLPPRTIVELRKLTDTPPDRFRFDDRLWAGIVYDFAIGYSLHVMPRDHLLRCLAPLYSGWWASFMLEMQSATGDEVEARVERVCQGFESEKRYLISRWRWPERFR